MSQNQLFKGPALSGSDPSKPATFCAKFTGQDVNGFCVAVCNPDAPGACRNGYTCTRNVARFGNPKEAKSVCLPAPR